MAYGVVSEAMIPDEPLKEELKHTPTPWERSTYTATPWFRQITEHSAICKEDGLLIAVNGGMDDLQSIVDADFIVEAVNNYATLQAKIEEMRKENEVLLWRADTETEAVERLSKQVLELQPRLSQATKRIEGLQKDVENEQIANIALHSKLWKRESVIKDYQDIESRLSEATKLIERLEKEKSLIMEGWIANKIESAHYAGAFNYDRQCALENIKEDLRSPSPKLKEGE